MKKLIFIGINILMCCSFCKCSIAQKNFTATRQVEGFGRYGNCSSGRGICGIDANNLDSKTNAAKFYIEKENDSVVVLKIHKQKITQADELILFGKAVTDFAKTEQVYFKMDADLPFENSAKEILGLKEQYSKILTGIYPVVKFNDYYLVELKLQ
jgi:hypothetical protein